MKTLFAFLPISRLIGTRTELPCATWLGAPSRCLDHTCRVHLFVQCPDQDFRGRLCVGYDHRWDGRIEVSSSRLPLVQPWRLVPEEPQFNWRIAYLDSTGRDARANSGAIASRPSTPYRTPGISPPVVATSASHSDRPVATTGGPRRGISTAAGPQSAGTVATTAMADDGDRLFLAKSGALR